MEGVYKAPALAMLANARSASPRAAEVTWELEALRPAFNAVWYIGVLRRQCTCVPRVRRCEKSGNESGPVRATSPLSWERRQHSKPAAIWKVGCTPLNDRPPAGGVVKAIEPRRDEVEP